MELQKHVCASICDGLPTPSANHPWLVDRDLEDKDNRDHIIYTMRDPPSQHKCRIPSFLGRRVWGCFYGWVVLSNHPHNDMWSLWNPMTFKIIRLPRLIWKNGDGGSNFTQWCCLSSPPHDHGSIFMLPTIEYTIVFCRLDYTRKRLQWVEMSYDKQMRSIIGYDSFLCSVTCCNGKVYALSDGSGQHWVIHIDIVVKGREIAISLSPYSKFPLSSSICCQFDTLLLKGCCKELFCIQLGHKYGTKRTFHCMRVFKLHITDIRWEEIEDLKDTTLFVDLAHDDSVFCSPSEVGGFVYLLDRPGIVIHSYDFKNRTMALSFMSERRLHGEIKSQEENEMAVLDVEVYSNSTKIDNVEENMESHVLNIPLDVLKTIMNFCVGVEYLNFRATCRQCHLAAPMIQWSKGGRLQSYSSVSPWLMVVHKDRDVISFTDPLFGDKYFIKKPQELIGDMEIHCSAGGWLLIRRFPGPLMFYNPFTGDIHELPLMVPYLQSYCFLDPPTSSDCVVVGFSARGVGRIFIHFVSEGSSWFEFHLNFCNDELQSFRFATHYGQSLYAVCNNGGLGFIDAYSQDYTWLNGPSNSCVSPKQNFLMKCDRHLLLVIVGLFGESIEVFKMNDWRQWEKTETLGRHAIYIGRKTCLCVETKTPEMANKIYFPRVHPKSRKIVFYSLETRRYHTSITEEGFWHLMPTEHYFDPHVWIEPSWS